MADSKQSAPLTPERWARIEEIFDRAVDLAPSKRDALLRELCGSDADLRRAVEKLLHEHDHEPAFLETPAIRLDEPADEAGHRTIGPYRIVRSLGRGGMGDVFLAEREAPGFRQLVALKLMRRGMDTDDLLARFRTERQILASLNHPNIARLLDVGATDDLPYFVMEYIDGAPLLEFCAERRLDTNARLQLFRSICDAVHHAHRSLVVHRDLKPHNILVTNDGVPKLLDFGIAKILDTHGEAGTSSHTIAGVRVLTPDYAAPEQLRGDAVTTACDVYALGTLLYQLLAGQHPFHKEGVSRSELVRLALDTEPPAPSRVLTESAAASRQATQAQLRRQLEGDLDTVVLKAMRKEPEARYASALSLSEDIDRYLSGLPVHARPATASYRIGKFVRRNRAAVTAAATVAVLLVASTAITLHQSGRVREEAARVRRERDKALEVRGFLLEMFGTTGPDQPTGDSVTARQLLDRRAAMLADAYSDNAEIRAEMMFVLAEGYEKLGLLGHAERWARESLDTRRDLFGPAHADVVASLDLLGWILHQLHRSAEAERLVREAVTIGRDIFGDDADARLARALNDLGIIRQDRGDYDEAAALYRESLAIRNSIAGEERLGLAITTSNLSVVLYRQQKIDSAVILAGQALDMLRLVLGPDHHRTTIAHSNLATMQSVKGDHQEAARQHRAILEQRRRLFGAQHASVALSMSLLAHELYVMKQYDEAERLLLDALEIQRNADGARGFMASTLRVLGDVRSSTDRVEMARDDYTTALALAREVYGETHGETRALERRIARLDSLQSTGHGS